MKIIKEFKYIKWDKSLLKCINKLKNKWKKLIYLWWFRLCGAAIALAFENILIPLDMILIKWIKSLKQNIDKNNETKIDFKKSKNIYFTNDYNQIGISMLRNNSSTPIYKNKNQTMILKNACEIVGKFKKMTLLVELQFIQEWWRNLCPNSYKNSKLKYKKILVLVIVLKN